MNKKNTGLATVLFLALALAVECAFAFHTMDGAGTEKGITCTQIQF